MSLTLITQAGGWSPLMGAERNLAQIDGQLRHEDHQHQPDVHAGRGQTGFSRVIFTISGAR